MHPQPNLYRLFHDCGGDRSLGQQPLGIEHGHSPAYFVVRWGVVGREEAYLEAKFGQTYTDYKNSVRRWF